jgi:drug/metabolite transporter (DMT)-like permease
VFTILSGLVTALSFATSDMLSQRVTRATRPLQQMLWVFATGAIIIVPVALLFEGLPDTGQWRGAGLAALAGVTYFVHLFCLLHGLRVGDLGLVCALTSLQGAYVAIVVVILGEPVTALLGFALCLCAVGAVLTSFEGRAKSTKGALWGIAAGITGAAGMLCFVYSDAPWLSQAAISRTVSLAITLPVVLLTGKVMMPKALRGRAVAAGALELSGIVFLSLAFTLGLPEVGGVTATQYGTFAVILGFVLLHERPRRHQWVGIVCTIVGVSLLAVIV